MGCCRVEKKYSYDGPFDFTFSRIDASNIPNRLMAMAYYGDTNEDGKTMSILAVKYSSEFNIFIHC